MPTLTERFITLSPVDTWFFRDGRPFNQDDEGLASARSVFPPFPETVVGAVRAALARGNGWDPARERSWSGNPTLRPFLGDGPDDLGLLGFGAPLVVRRAAQAWQPLFPVPLSLLGKPTATGRRWTSLTLVRPGTAVDCDIGTGTRLPCLPSGAGEGLKSIEDCLLTADGMTAFLEGNVPAVSELVPKRSLWREETRIGLGRDGASRTAIKGQLYTAAHMRPDDREPSTHLGISVTGVPDRWRPQPLSSVGGEHRSGWIEMAARAPDLPVVPATLLKSGPTLDYVVVLISPARPDGEWWRSGGALSSSLPGEIIAACIDRPVLIGGWDGRQGSGQPRMMEPFLRPGSVWFMRAKPGDAARLADPGGPAAIGEKKETDKGYGRFLIGVWQEEGSKG